jgi:hypothetical protein
LNLGAAGNAEAFVGLDTGHVSGPSAKYLVGQSLTGAAIGLRGAWRNLSYEVFVATPVKAGALPNLPHQPGSEPGLQFLRRRHEQESSSRYLQQSAWHPDGGAGNSFQRRQGQQWQHTDRRC